MPLPVFLSPVQNPVRPEPLDIAGAAKDVIGVYMQQQQMKRQKELDEQARKQFEAESKLAQDNAKRQEGYLKLEQERLKNKMQGDKSSMAEARRKEMEVALADYWAAYRTGNQDLIDEQSQRIQRIDPSWKPPGQVDPRLGSGIPGITPPPSGTAPEMSGKQISQGVGDLGSANRELAIAQYLGDPKSIAEAHSRVGFLQRGLPDVSAPEDTGGLQVQDEEPTGGTGGGLQQGVGGQSGKGPQAPLELRLGANERLIGEQLQMLVDGAPDYGKDAAKAAQAFAMQIVRDGTPIDKARAAAVARYEKDMNPIEQNRRLDVKSQAFGKGGPAPGEGFGGRDLATRKFETQRMEQLKKGVEGDYYLKSAREARQLMMKVKTTLSQPGGVSQFAGIQMLVKAFQGRPSDADMRNMLGSGGAWSQFTTMVNRWDPSKGGAMDPAYVGQVLQMADTVLAQLDQQFQAANTELDRRIAAEENVSPEGRRIGKNVYVEGSGNGEDDAAAAEILGEDQ